MKQGRADRDSADKRIWSRGAEDTVFMEINARGRYGRRAGKRIFAFLLAMLLAFSPLETVSYAEEESRISEGK